MCAPSRATGNPGSPRRSRAATKAARALALLSSALWIGAAAPVGGSDRPEPAPLQPEWRAFRSEEGRFSVPLPAAPAVTASTHHTLLGPIRGSMYAAELGDLSVSVELHDLPRIAAFLFSPDTILDRARKALLEGVGGRPLDAESAPHMGHPARDVRYALADPAFEIERALLVLVERRLYILIATWPEPAPSDAHLARLFESFEVWAP